jgi:hypothetical protein
MVYMASRNAWIFIYNVFSWKVMNAESLDKIVCKFFEILENSSIGVSAILFSWRTLAELHIAPMYSFLHDVPPHAIITFAAMNVGERLGVKLMQYLEESNNKLVDYTKKIGLNNTLSYLSGLHPLILAGSFAMLANVVIEGTEYVMMGYHNPAAIQGISYSFFCGALPYLGYRIIRKVYTDYVNHKLYNVHNICS